MDGRLRTLRMRTTVADVVVGTLDNLALQAKSGKNSKSVREI